MALLRVLRRVLSPSLLAGFAIGAVLTVGVGAAFLGSAVFSDVPSGSYYDSAVGEMYELGIIKGYEDGKFHPNDAVTRAQVAVMMQRLRNELRGVTPPEPAPEPASEQQSSSSVSSSVESSSSVSSSSSSSSRSRSSRSSSSSSSLSGSASPAASTKNPYGLFRFAAASINLSEAGKATISILRTGGDRGAVSVAYRTANGTATAGEDYVETSGEVSFADGETSKLVSIVLKDDLSSEGAENFTFTLHTPTGGAALGTPATVTISLLDNEASGATTSSSSSSGGGSAATNPAGEFGFSAASYAVSENAGSVTITVIRSGGTTGIVNVNYATADGSAKAGTDYAATNGTLTFGAGETSKTFTVTVYDETSEFDGNKTANLVLSSPTNTAVLGSPTPVVLTIMDNEAIPAGTGSLKLSASTYNTTEDAGRVTVTVQRVGGSRGTVTVQYRSFDGTARAGSDYTAVSGTLTFLPGEASKVVRIDIKDDTEVEGEENINFSIDTVTGGARLLTPFTALIKLQG